MKLLTCVVPCYNSAGWMERAVDSLLAGGEETEILIVDEVLSVGDYQFRKKCNERMEQMLSGGTTLLYVSHDIPSVKRLCDHAMWLDHGTARMSGRTEEVLAAADHVIRGGQELCRLLECLL